MLKTLISLFGWIPGLGEVLKMTYIANCAREIAIGVKVDQSKAELQGEELEEYINELAQKAYDESLKSEVVQLGLPDFATNKANEEAVTIIAKKIKEKYQEKIV